MMSHTLLDLSTLLGIRPDEDSISALFVEKNFSIPPLTLDFEKNLSNQVFIQTYKKNKGPVSNEE